MRLLLVIDSFGSGGAQRQLVQLAIGLAAAGHSVEFFIYAPHHDHFRDVVDAAGIPVHVHRKRGRFAPGPVLALAALMRRARYDVVLAYLTTPGIYAELASVRNRLHGRRTPVVVSERGPLAHVSTALRLALGVHHLASHLVTNSRNNLDQLLSLWPSLRARASVIYNGVDLEHFHPTPTPRAASPAQLNVLAIGTLVPTKEAMVLVEALALHRERYGWVPTVSWVGKLSPHGGDADYERRVRERLVALNLGASWSWLGERHDVPALLRSHDVLVHPSVLEGLPNAVCEALACGLPVIAARIGDNEALVAEGVTGFLHAPGDPVALAEALAAFAGLTEARRAAMRSAARTFAADSLALDRCIAAYEQLFRRLSA
jgi:glycosyltransferase involved in cell wall biosynthesis